MTFLPTIATVLTAVFGIISVIVRIFRILPKEISTPLRKFAAPAFIVSVSLLIGSLLENITDNIATPITMIGFVLAILYMLWNTLSKHQRGASNKAFSPASTIFSVVCIAASSITIGVLLEEYDDNTTVIFSTVGCVLALVYLVAVIWANMNRQEKLAEGSEE